MKNSQTKFPGKERGVAALGVGLILLLAITIVTIFAAKVGIQEQRISNNEYRYKMAFETAEAGLNFGQYYFKVNQRNIYPNASNPNAWTWNRCDGTDPEPPEWKNPVLADLCQGRIGTNNWLWSCVPDGSETCPGSDRTVQPAGTNADNTSRYRVLYLTDAGDTGTSPQPLDRLQVTIISEGTSDSGAGNAFSKVDISTTPVIANNPDAPIIASGLVGGAGSGNFEIVTNPNGGGKGVPLSIWCGTDADIIGNSTLDTCYPHEFYETGIQSGSPPYIYNELDPSDTENSYSFQKLQQENIVLCPGGGNGCSCSDVNENDILTKTNPGGSDQREGIDVLDDDGDSEGINPDTTNFPTDLFMYLFGIPNTQYEQKKDQATIIPDCTVGNLPDANASGFYWVEGDCKITGNRDIGSPVNPVLVVVEDEVDINGGRFFGILYAWTETGSTGSTVSVTGSAQFYGAIIADRGFNPSGGPQVIYNDKVLQNLANNLRSPSRIPGSWFDYQD